MAGLTFEVVCRDHVKQIKRKLGIAGVQTDEYTFLARGDSEVSGTQIDMVLDRMDHVIDLCEVKYSEREFTIDKEADANLRNKREVFRTMTRTKKTLQIVMMTTFGVKENKYSSILSGQIFLDDLFSGDF